MRYTINDDDFENWIKLLFNLNQTLKNEILEYIISEMENELKFNQEVLQIKIEHTILDTRTGITKTVAPSDYDRCDPFIVRIYHPEDHKILKRARRAREGK